MKTYIAAVPVDDVPNFPEMVDYSTYEQVKCHHCPRLVWLGERCKARALADKEAEIVCPYCLADIEGLENAQKLVDNMRVLADEN